MAETTKIFILRDEDDVPISAHTSLADAQEMLLTLAFDEMYYDFCYWVYFENTSPEEWFNMKWQDRIMNCALFHRPHPTNKTLWGLLEFYTDYYYIDQNIPMFM